MARTVRDAKLETREARSRLPARAKPYWRTLRPGELHLGYVKRRRDTPGHWTVRRYLGAGASGSPYEVEKLKNAVADDYEAANGVDTLSFAQAQDRALAQRAAVNAPITVRTAMAEYVQYLHDEKKTGDAIEQTAENVILPAVVTINGRQMVLGDVKVTDLTTECLEQWKQDMAKAPARLRGGKVRHAVTKEEKDARKSTANRLLTTLKACLNKAAKLKKLNNAEWRAVEPFKDVTTSRDEIFEIEECQRLINAANRESGFRDLLRAALLTGMRYSELGRLQVRDFRENKIHVRKSKSGKSRYVTLTAKGVAFFSKLCRGKRGSEQMLPNHRRVDKLWVKNAQSLLMEQACVAADVPLLGFHQTRHSYASHSVMAGMTLMVLAQNLGHTSIRMVEEHYGHLRKGYVDEQIEKYAPDFGTFDDDEASNVQPLRGAA